MELPANLKYTDDHEWLRLEGENTAYIGITYFAQGELGDIVYVEVDSIGETIEKGEIFGTVEAVKTTADLFMPVSGEVLEFNEKLSADGEDDPALINSDPYGDGWIVKIKLTNLEELEGLMDAEAYQKEIS